MKIYLLKTVLRLNSRISLINPDKFFEQSEEELINFIEQQHQESEQIK